MARSMADDYQDTYRARIVWRYRKGNPDHDWNRGSGSDNPRWIDDPEAKDVVSCYGPYANRGTAKAQFSQHRYSFGYEDRIQVIEQKVQKASITWEDVDE